MATDPIITVNEVDFEFQVLEYSKQIPVVVDFWAAWCGPCKTLGPMLERLAVEANGGFRLAKLDVDANPNLALRYNVRSIPTVKAFRDAKIEAEFIGAIPEVKLREFLRSLAPSEHDLILEKGLSLANENKWAGAEACLKKFLTRAPSHPAATLGMARCHLAQGRIQEAQRLLTNFPPSPEFSHAELLLSLVKSLNWAKTTQAEENDTLTAAFVNSLRLAGRGNYAAAMDGILDILRQDKRYRNGEARQALVGLFELLGPDSTLTKQYRQELALVLF